jgi:protoporphyrinogen oxidase
MKRERICIIGTGMAGFGAAHRFHQAGLPTVTFEKRAYHGGHTASHPFAEGFLFDEGPHISFTKDERLQALFAESVGGEYETLQTNVNNYWRGHWIKHPAQTNLYGLPSELITSIIKDFVAVHNKPVGEIKNYADWLVASYGETFARTFPMEYTVKYHTTTAENMSTDWIGPRMYQPSLEEVLRGALAPAAAEVHYITHFRYPKRGGFVQFLNKFVEETEIRCDHELVRVDPKRRELHFRNGRVEAYDHLVSSVPLPELIPMIDGTPPDVLAAAARLTCSELVVVNLGFKKPEITDATWTYFYDRDFFLTRLSTPHLQSRNNVPPGCCSVQAECYFSDKYRPLDRRPEDCIPPVIEDLKRCGLIAGEEEIIFRNVMHIKYANVIFDLESAPAAAIVHGYLDDLGIQYCGRYGEWAYIWTDQSFLSGENAATRVIDGLGRKQTVTAAVLEPTSGS